MRLLLVGAFAYPHVQGSQVYFQEQAIALRDAGVSVELLTYGGGPTLPRALAGFAHSAIPAWTAPRSSRSGPKAAKGLADLALARRLRALDVPRFDAVLAHHAEAALAALHALPASRPPIVYCAHTLLAEELPTYFAAARPALRFAGRALDRWIARRADAWIALTAEAERFFLATSERPGRLIPPPVPASAPLSAPGRHFLYAGNLDAYQEVRQIVELARARIRRGAPRPGGGDAATPALPIVIATHDPRAGQLEAQLRRGAAGRDRAASREAHGDGEGLAAPLRVVRVETADEVVAWTAAARASIVPRRALGGFPIKLANALAVGTPVVAYHGDEWGLRDGVDALVCDPTRPVESLAAALARLEGDDALARRLRCGARATWSARHRPEHAAAAVIELVGKLGVGRRSTQGD